MSRSKRAFVEPAGVEEACPLRRVRKPLRRPVPRDVSASAAVEHRARPCRIADGRIGWRGIMGEPGRRAWAIVVAAGEGKRMREGPFARGPRKPFVELAGRPILLRTLDAIARSGSVERTVVAVAAEDLAAAEELIAPERDRLLVAAIVEGGARRQDSVARALAVVPEEIELVAVHDGARPLVEPELFDRALGAAGRTGAACVSLPVGETLKRVEEGAGSPPMIGETVDRSRLWAAQTPQAFRRADLARLLGEADREGIDLTDDAQAFDRSGLPVEAVPGSPRNIKITTPEDLAMAEAILASPGDVRVGTGFDMHPLAPGRRLVACGVELDSPVGGEGHSDADAATHAVVDALLGACAMGDIGTLFPDTEPKYKDADSVGLLAEATARLRDAGFEPRSLDVTVLLEKPKLVPHIDRMRGHLARAVGIPEDRVSVKAKTMNGIGPVGEGKAYAAQATAVVGAGGRSA